MLVNAWRVPVGAIGGPASNTRPGLRQKTKKEDKMDVKYPKTRAQVFEAVRVLSTSPESIQRRLIEATESLLAVTIDEFAQDPELTIKFTRILDLIAVDRGDVEAIAVETAAYMSDTQASIIADLVCDFLYEIA
jgi:hypothetical protein